MPWRVHDVLLVSSFYDSFILSEDGELLDSVVEESIERNRRNVPRITRVSTGEEALAMARERRSFSLVLTSLQVGSMNARELARSLREAGLEAPVAVLAYDGRELAAFLARYGEEGLDGVFLWQGDVMILMAIVRLVEDRMNLAHDAAAGVQIVLLVEDSVRYYSSFLPMIYAEILAQSRRLAPEGMNLAHRLRRLEARPKILLCKTWEEARAAFDGYRENVLGVISDVEFRRGGVLAPLAGVDLAQEVRRQAPDVPVMLQSTRPEVEAAAHEAGALFQLKGSPLLLQDLRLMIDESFGFGDFVFKLPGGKEVARAKDMKELEERLQTVPAESIAFHAERNHFSTWLKARTEFALAYELRPRKVRDFPTVEDLRKDTIEAIRVYKRDLGRRSVADFVAETWDGSAVLGRLGSGSLGGKARGLAFVNKLLQEEGIQEKFPGVQVRVPSAVVVATDAFDRFLDLNDLREEAISEADDSEVLRRFLGGEMPAATLRDLEAFARRTRHPVAVRSSSLLEDSQYQPLAGAYKTCMLPNVSPDPVVRLARIVEAIKRVWASTFSSHAKAYLKATPFRTEQEKMAVILQRVVGAPHGGRFYPTFAGAARSHNFYPSGPMKTDDGVAAVALGFGESVRDVDACVRFCPRYPRHLSPYSSPRDLLRGSQRHFFALPLVEREEGPPLEGLEFALESFGLDAAERDGTLSVVGSTYSPENDALYDGLGRPGVRLVSFAPILKHGVFPLAEILDLVLEVGTRGTGGPVEIEFAANLSVPPDRPKEFAILQLRPLALARDTAELEIGKVPEESVVCRSRMVLGNGRVDNLRDAVVVDPRRFDRAQSRDAAAEVARLNVRLLEEGRPYLLVGIGRWGSADPFLGIPVSWDEISGARVIVEAGFRDVRVTPSQGSHFFQNLAAGGVGYFTVNPESGDGTLDWDWLDAQPTEETFTWARHVRLDAPFSVRMNGRLNEGVILKPGSGA